MFWNLRGSVLSRSGIVILACAACNPGVAWVFVQPGSASTSVLIDCPGQAYAGILSGQEERFCFWYLWVRGQSPCFSTQSQHSHFFSGTILKRWKKNWFDLWSDGHLVYYDDQTRQSVEDKVHMPVDCINIRMGRECRGKWACRASFWHLPFSILGGGDSSFLATVLSFTDQRRVSCRKR